MEDRTEELENIVVAKKMHRRSDDYAKSDTTVVRRTSNSSSSTRSNSSSSTASRSTRSSNTANTVKKKPVSNKKKSDKKLAKKKTKVIAGVITAISFAFALTFCVLLFNLKMLPGLYFGILCVILLVMIAGIAFMMFGAKKIQRLLGGVVLSLLFDILMGTGIYYINVSTKALKNITTTKTEVSIVDVYVRSDDAAQSIEDTNGYTFGILTELDRDNTDSTIKKINKDLGYEITTNEYSGYVDMVNALENGEIDAFILNTAYIDIIKDMPDYENIDDRIRSVAEYKIKHKTEVAKTEEDTGDKHVFTVYISGIDSREGLIAKSRSDSNILLTVNTETKQILMVNTPRDYYVPLSISGGARDKLTHAGIYGVDVSMATLSMLYNINVDYYFRVNFSGFEQIVDALGGINVYSDVAFTTLHGNYYIQAGDNYLNGAEALGFARERYALAGGDNDRGQNQMKVIKAIIAKMTSTDFLMNYTGVLDSLQGSFETSIPMDLISSIVRDQLSNGGDWNVVNYAVTGTGDTQIPWSMGTGAYVMWPNEDTVATATSLMQQVENGEIITQP